MSAITMIRDRRKKRIYAGPDWSRSAPLSREQEFVDWHRERGFRVGVQDGEVHEPYAPVEWDGGAA